MYHWGHHTTNESDIFTMYSVVNERKRLRGKLIFFACPMSVHILCLNTKNYIRRFPTTQKSRLADTIFCRVLQDVHINEVILLYNS